MQQCAVYILYLNENLLYMFQVQFTPNVSSTGTVAVDRWFKLYVAIDWAVWLVMHQRVFVDWFLTHFAMVSIYIIKMHRTMNTKCIGY
jgi:hypothetical protein